MEDRIRRTWDEIEKAAEGAPSAVRQGVSGDPLRGRMLATLLLDVDEDRGPIDHPILGRVVPVPAADWSEMVEFARSILGR